MGGTHEPEVDRPAQKDGFSMDALTTSIGFGSIAGAAAGFIWGGVGGRIAMRIVFLTSDDRVRGVISDDGFEIGRISAETIFLLIFATAIGVVMGAIFGGIRALVGVPTRVLAPAIGIAAAAGGGSLLVNADGIDFRILEPLWLTVGLFVFIPGAWGITVVYLSDWLLTPGRLLKSLQPGINHRVAGRVGSITGWVFLAAITVLSAVFLIRDVSDLA